MLFLLLQWLVAAVLLLLLVEMFLLVHQLVAVVVVLLFVAVGGGVVVVAEAAAVAVGKIDVGPLTDLPSCSSSFVSRAQVHKCVKAGVEVQLKYTPGSIKCTFVQSTGARKNMGCTWA